MKKFVLVTAALMLGVLVLSSFSGISGNIISDGTYSVDVAFEGGTGRAKVLSPAELVVKDGVLFVTITWSSKNYDYMIVDDVKYMNLTPGKNSSFSFPIKELGKPIDVIGDSIS